MHNIVNMKKILLILPLFFLSCSIETDRDKLETLKCPVVIVAIDKNLINPTSVVVKDSKGTILVFTNSSVAMSLATLNPGDTIK